MRHLLPGAVFWLILGSLVARAGEPTLFFERRIPTQWIAGTAEMREVVGDNYVDVSLQTRETGGDIVTVVQQKHYRQLLDVRLQSKAWVSDRAHLEDRGTLLLAMDAGWDEYDAFSKSLREALVNLGPRAYLNPLAGIDPHWKPLSFAVLGAIPGDPLFCLSAGAGFNGFQHRSRPRADGSKDVMTIGVSSEVCRAIGRAAGNKAPSVLDSTQRESQEDLVQRISTLQEPASFPAVAPRNPLPPEAAVVKAPEDGRTADFGLGFDLPAMPRRYVTVGTTRYSAEAPPAAIPADALRGASRVIRWDLRDSFHRYGRAAAERDGTVEHVLVATFFTDRPSAEGEAATPTDLTRLVPNWERYLDRVGDVLEGQSTITVQSIEEATVLGHLALLEDGYFVIVCRDDGTASYYLGPAFAYNKVTNPQDVCARLEQRLAN